MTPLHANENMYVYLIPTLQCNLRHSFCFQRSFSTAKLEDDILYKKLLPLYEKTACLRLHGGELTTVPKMKDFVKFLGEKYPEMTINLVTNGVLFDEAWCELAAKYNIIINYSLNSISEEGTGKILPTFKSAKKVHTKIHDNLYRLVQTHKASSRNIINLITMAVCHDTLDEMAPLAQEGLKYGLNVAYQFPCEVGACIDKKILNAVYLAATMKCYCNDFININLIHAPMQKKIADMIEHIQKDPDFQTKKENFFARLSHTPQKSKCYDILTYENDVFEGPEAFICPRPWQGLFINSLGDVFPCSNAPGYVMGNVYNQEIEEILASPARLALQDKIKNNCYAHCWESCNMNYFPETSAPKATLEEILPYKKLFEDGRHEQLIRLLSSALEAGIELPNDALYMLAFSCHMTHKSEEALIYYQKALEAGFPEFWIKYNRGALLLDLNRIEEAKSDIRRAYHLDSRHEGIKILMERIGGGL